MRRLLPALLLFAAALGLTGTEPRALAQPKDVVEESFRTADGVELAGRFTAATKKDVNARSAPVVVLMYEPGVGKDFGKADWSPLIKKLNDEGFHVYQFDWRGHGKSTDIKDAERFWMKSPYLNGKDANAPNSYIKGGPGKPLKEKLVVKEVTNANKFFPAYAMDLAALRYHLDTKNDNGDLNTSSLYLLGEGDTAALGLAWITMEWKRPRVKPGDNQLVGAAGIVGAARYDYIGQQLRGDFDEAGQDYAGAVWLSASRPTAITTKTLQTWVKEPTFAPQLRNNTPMLFLTGDKDTKGKADAKFFFEEVLVAEPKPGSPLPKLKQTFRRELEGGGTDRGVKLVGGTAKAEETVIKFLKDVQKERQRTAPAVRKYENSYGIDLKYFGLR
jgi:pimeloyl-ACP methyl ester carboxylesterase